MHGVGEVSPGSAKPPPQQRHKKDEPSASTMRCKNKADLRRVVQGPLPDEAEKMKKSFDKRVAKMFKDFPPGSKKG